MPTKQSTGLRLPLLLLAAACIGGLGALATHGFRLLLEGISHGVFGSSAGPVQLADSLPPALRLAIPVLGGMLAGAILQQMPHIRQHAVDYMESITLGSGRLSLRATLLRAASSAASIVSGSAIGREGSMIQLAALAASLGSRPLHPTRQQRRLLLACGAAAGVSAAYNTPIAGALFVAEIILRTVSIDTLGPLLLTAACAQLLSSSLFGDAAIYQLPEMQLQGSSDWLWFAVLGLTAGLLLPAFQRLLLLSRKLFEHLRLPLWLKLAAGGGIVGGLSLLTPHAWGNGYDSIDQLLHGSWPLDMLLLVLCCKLLATAAATGSGAVGGIFTPTLFAGAVLGAIAGTAAQPLLAQPAGALWIIAGMGAFLAAATQAPLMAIIMLFEMTRSPMVTVPLMLAVATAHLTARVLGCRSIYAHAGEPPADTSILHVMEHGVPQLGHAASLRQLADTFATWRWQHVYITHPQHGFLGAVPIHDFHCLQQQGISLDARIPEQLIRRDFPAIHTDMRLAECLELMVAHHGERLPVVGEHGELLGYLRKSRLLQLLAGRWQ